MVEKILTVAEAIIASEHNNFLRAVLDNNEHIPRVRRIARTVAEELAKMDVPPEEVLIAEQRLRSFGKDLFMKEWAAEIDESEDVEEVMTAGFEEFERIYESE